MPIMNTQVKGGGVVPSGTLAINTNGVHDVTNYASADVQVPSSAPDYYIGFRKNGTTLHFDGSVINLSGITDVGYYVLFNKYEYCSFNANTTVNWSSLTGVSSERGCYGTFYYSRNIISIDLSGLVSISGLYSCQVMCQYCSELQSADLRNLTTVSGTNGCQYMFGNCTNLTSVNLSNLTTISGSSGCSNMFSNCTALTSISLPKLTNLSGNSALNGAFSGSGITSIDLSKVTTRGDRTYQNMCQNCKSLTTANIAKLKSIISTHSWVCASTFSGCSSLTTENLDCENIYGQYGFYQTYYGCTSLASKDFFYLSSVEATSACSSMFNGCTSLTRVDFWNLNYVSGNNAFSSCFSGCTSLTDVKFWNLRMMTPFGSYPNCLNNFLSGVTGCTIHFPKGLDPQTGSTAISSLTGYPYFGGTNTVLAFDLPTAYIMDAANGKQYRRNAYYDTATSLAWRTTTDGVFSSVSYYTSGTADPQVGDTLYSDSACTVAVTTISSLF